MLIAQGVNRLLTVC